MTYFLGVCMGEGVVEMNIWSLFFLLKNSGSYSKLVFAQTWGVKLNMDRCGQGEEGSKITENVRTSFLDSPL